MHPVMNKLLINLLKKKYILIRIIPLISTIKSIDIS